METLIPYKHQIEGVDFILNRGGSGCLFHGMGTGKTLSALILYKKLKEKEPSLQLFVICPVSLIKQTWEDHIDRFFPEFKYCNLRGKKDHWPLCDIYLINYENVVRKATLLKINTLVSTSLWMCVIDESAKLKSNSTLITKACIFLRDRFKYRLCLSGLPAPNNELNYWGQLSFIDRMALSPSFSQFRNTYFYLSDRMGREIAPSYSKAGMFDLFHKQGAHYMANKHKQKDLMRRIGQYAHFVSMEEALPNLPPLVEEIRSIELSAEEMSIYKEMRRHLVIEIKEEQISAANILTKLIKLRQLVSGFVFNEQGIEIPVEIKGLPSKLKELKSIIEEIGSDQAIIWCDFKYQVRSVSEMLTKEGKTYSTLYSETVDRDKNIQDFKEGKTQFLISNPMSGGIGLNLQNAHIEIYYSVNYSLELMDQSQKRIHRGGQTHKCVAIYILALGTIDEEIFEIVKGKRDLDQILKGYLK